MRNATELLELDAMARSLTRSPDPLKDICAEFGFDLFKRIVGDRLVIHGGSAHSIYNVPDDTFSKSGTTRFESYVADDAITSADCNLPSDGWIHVSIFHVAEGYGRNHHEWELWVVERDVWLAAGGTIASA